MPPPAPSLSPARGSRTSPCSPFCPVYTTLFTDSRLHPAPSPTCGGGGCRAGRKQSSQLSRGPGLSGPPSPSMKTELILTPFSWGGHPPPPYTHTFCPGSPLRSLFTAGRHQVPSAPQAMRGGRGAAHQHPRRGWLPWRRAVCAGEGGWQGVAVQAVDLTCKVCSAQLCTPETSIENRGPCKYQHPSTSRRRMAHQPEWCPLGAGPGPASDADLLWPGPGGRPGPRGSSQQLLPPPAGPSGDLGGVVGSSSE